MMELKRIGECPYSFEKSAPPEMNWGIRERCFYEGADAQQEADKETVRTLVQEMFEEIESKLGMVLVGTAYIDAWQALKQKYLKEVNIWRT